MCSWCSDVRLLTPRIDQCGVAGVMRRVILREARQVGFRRGNASCARRIFSRADEIFLTNARIGIWPVRGLDGRSSDHRARSTRHLQSSHGTVAR